MRMTFVKNRLGIKMLRKTITKKTTLLFLLTTILLFFSQASVSAFLPGVEELERNHGAPTGDWYEVDDWEIDFCTGYAGTLNPEESSGGRMVNTQLSVSTKNTIALQAQSQPVIPSSAINSSKLTLYEVSWFVQPVLATDGLTYEVWMVSVEEGWTSLESDDADYINGYRGYKAFESSNNYTFAKIKYQDNDESGELIVPFAT